MKSIKSSNAYGTFVLQILIIILLSISRQASSYQTLLCLKKQYKSCDSCQDKCDELGYVLYLASRETEWIAFKAICEYKGTKDENCCCKRSALQPYHAPIEAPSS